MRVGVGREEATAKGKGEGGGQAGWANDAHSEGIGNAFHGSKSLHLF